MLYKSVLIVLTLLCGILLPFIYEEIFGDSTKSISELFSSLDFDKEFKQESHPKLWDKNSQKIHYGRYLRPFFDAQLPSHSYFQAFFAKKEWHFVSLDINRYFLGIAVGQLNYASVAFSYLYDTETNLWAFVHKHTLLGRDTTFAQSSLQGCTEWSNSGNSLRFCSIGSTQPNWRIEANFLLNDTIMLTANFTCSGDQSMCLVYPLNGGRFSYVHKSSAMLAQGSIDVDGHHITFDKGLVNSDWTRGLLERYTSWYWASLSFITPQNQRIGLQISKGVYDDPSGNSMESSISIDDIVYPLTAPVLWQVPDSLMQCSQQWKMSSSEFELTFIPHKAKISHEYVPLWIDMSFYHCVGRFQGKITFQGSQEIIVDALGIAEDHKAKW